MKADEQYVTCAAAKKLASVPVMKMRSLIAALLICAAPVPVQAGASDWYEVEGGRVRLVTAGRPDVEGTLRGALQIELHPGWKTYWRDPGDAGIPPTIKVDRSLNVASVEIGFPAPMHFEDGYASWAGYAHSLSLPLTFKVPVPDAAVIVTADVLLGICESICIPVNAALEVDPNVDPDNGEHGEIIRQGFAALPAASHDGFEIVSSRTEGHHVIVKARIPDGQAPDLFVASPQDWRLGPARMLPSDPGHALFRIKILDRPGTSAATFTYTLSAGGRAVDGQFQTK